MKNIFNQPLIFIIILFLFSSGCHSATDAKFDKLISCINDYMHTMQNCDNIEQSYFEELQDCKRHCDEAFQYALDACDTIRQLDARLKCISKITFQHNDCLANCTRLRGIRKEEVKKLRRQCSVDFEKCAGTIK